MPLRHYADDDVNVNEEGFLLDAAQWTRAVAEAIAEEVGIAPLTDKHWAVIRFCREDSAARGQAPGLRRIALASGVGMKDLYRLFPRGPGKLAARVSGLPKPKSCV